MAEGRGFEPPRDLLGPYPISSRTPSTGLGHPSASTYPTHEPSASLPQPSRQVTPSKHPGAAVRHRGAEPLRQSRCRRDAPGGAFGADLPTEIENYSSANPPGNPRLDLYVGALAPDGNTIVFPLRRGGIGGAGTLGAPASVAPLTATPAGFAFSQVKFLSVHLPGGRGGERHHRRTSKNARKSAALSTARTPPTVSIR
jgi:hypothetical protein